MILPFPCWEAVTDRPVCETLTALEPMLISTSSPHSLLLPVEAWIQRGTLPLLLCSCRASNSMTYFYTSFRLLLEMSLPFTLSKIDHSLHHVIYLIRVIINIWTYGIYLCACFTRKISAWEESLDCTSSSTFPILRTILCMCVSAHSVMFNSLQPYRL